MSGMLLRVLAKAVVAPVFKSVASAVSDGTTASILTCTLPTSDVGDLLIATVSARRSSAPTFTTPSGWTLIGSSTIGNTRLSSYWRIKVSGDNSFGISLGTSAQTGATIHVSCFEKNTFKASAPFVTGVAAAATAAASTVQAINITTVRTNAPPNSTVYGAAVGSSNATATTSLRSFQNTSQSRTTTPSTLLLASSVGVMPIASINQVGSNESVDYGASSTNRIGHIFAIAPSS